MDKIDMYDQNLLLADWKVISDDKTEGLVIYQRTTENGLKAMKATGVVKRKAMDIFKVLGNDVYRKDYNKTYDSGATLSRIAD
jgi:hypothetical protein